MAHADNKPDNGPTWQSLAVAACMLFCAIFGWILTDTLYTNRADIKRINDILEARSTLQHRVAVLEESVKRLEEDRLRDLSERANRNSR